MIDKPGTTPREKSKVRFNIRLLLTLIVMSVTGCAGLSAEGARVRLTNNPDVVKGCEFIANVKGSSGWGRNAAQLGENNVENKMKNQTAKLGGNTVYLISSKSGFTSYGIGEAYRCLDVK